MKKIYFLLFIVSTISCSHRNWQSNCANHNHIHVNKITVKWIQKNLCSNKHEAMLIYKSIKHYHINSSSAGTCPCPYNIMTDGDICGASSAYSKPGGAAPLCYPKDIK